MSNYFGVCSVFTGASYLMRQQLYWFVSLVEIYLHNICETLKTPGCTFSCHESADSSSGVHVTIEQIVGHKMDAVKIHNVHPIITYDVFNMSIKSLLETRMANHRVIHTKQQSIHFLASRHLLTRMQQGELQKMRVCSS